MNSNIILLSGSPRRGENTDKLAAAFIEGAESAGNTVTLYRAADMKISGCLGCEHCTNNNGICVQNDDMTPVIETLRNADTLVLASPVYYCSITAQLKLLTDRAYALHNQKTNIKKTAMLLTCADDPGTADGMLPMYKACAVHFKWEVTGIIIAGGLFGDVRIDGRPELEQARKLGREI